MVYGGSGDVIFDYIKKDVQHVLPVIKDRIKENKTKACTNRSNKHLLWKRIHIQNFHKGLDHRSLNFK